MVLRRSGCSGLLPVDLRRFSTAGKQPVEENIQVLGDFHRKPHLATGGTDLDGNIKDQCCPTIALREPRTTGGGAARRCRIPRIASAPPPAVVVAPPAWIRLAKAHVDRADLV